MIAVVDWDKIVRLERAMRSGPRRNILQLFEVAGLDPKVDFRGGDWRFVHFDGLDLRGLDFSHARLFGSHFAKSQVAGANFVDSDVEVTNFHHALEWRSADLDYDQRAILELKSVRQNGEPLDGRAVAAIRRSKALGEGQWVNLIKAAKSFQIAEQVYEMMAPAGDNYAKNKFALTSLLTKATLKKEVDDVLARFAALGVPTDRHVINTLISKATSETEARAWFEKYREQFEPTIYSFNALLSKIERIESAQDILDEMIRSGLKPNHISLNPFIWKAATFEEALRIYRRLEQPRTVDKNAVFHHVEERHWEDGAVEALLAEEPGPDLHTFNILIHQSGRIDRAWALVAQIKAASLRPDKFTLFNMLTRFEAGEVDSAVTAIARMRREGVDVAHWDTVRFLLRTVPDASGEGHRIILAMEEEGGSWNEVLLALARAFARPEVTKDLERALMPARALADDQVFEDRKMVKAAPLTKEFPELN